MWSKVKTHLGRAATRTEDFLYKAIAPGLIKTDFSAFFHESLDRIKSIERTQSIPRIGLVDEIGYAALFLASDEASFITGEVMVIDGGAMVAKGASV